MKTIIAAAMIAFAPFAFAEVERRVVLACLGGQSA